jgi:hypothetical protein
MRSILSLAVVGALVCVTDAQAFGKRNRGCSSTGCSSGYSYSGGYTFSSGCNGNTCAPQAQQIPVPQPTPTTATAQPGSQTNTLLIMDSQTGQIRPATAEEIRRANPNR